jgi:hypothetical protein
VSSRCPTRRDGYLTCCRVVGHDGEHHWHSHLKLSPAYPHPHTFGATTYGGTNLRCSIGAELDGVTP